MTNPFITIEHAINELRNGRMIILVDDEHRENEGDLVVAAEFATPDAINFMSHYGRGIICMPMAEHLIDKLRLPMMASRNRCPFGTAFTVSIEAASGVSTGVSTKDRARTIQVAISPDSGPEDIISPGHVFPLRPRTKGVLERGGQTEGSIDLMKIAGLTPAAAICEIMNEDGSMSRLDDLVEFSKQHSIPLVSIRDILEYRITHENLLEEAATSRIPMQHHGNFNMTVFHNQIDDAEHFALVKEPIYKNQVPLIRIHSECITGDVFGSCKCDCGLQLQESLSLISAEGGVLVYLRQEGRGIGLANKLKAYALQEQGLDTVEANLELGLPVDNRSYAVAYQILKHFGVKTARMLTNNPGKVEAITRYGIKVSERISLSIPSNNENRRYLKAKRDKLGHFIAVEEE